MAARMTGVKIKFCGITRPQDAQWAEELGAWAIGMVLWPGSPRACAELWPVIAPILAHAVDLLHGRTRHEKP